MTRREDSDTGTYLRPRSSTGHGGGVRMTDGLVRTKEVSGKPETDPSPRGTEDKEKRVQRQALSEWMGTS